MGNLEMQIGISSLEGHGGRRYRPYVFTEQGVAMLSSVLKSKRAVQVNIAIMRAFVQLREMLSSHKDLARKLEEWKRNTTPSSRLSRCNSRADETTRVASQTQNRLIAE